jgi:phosphate:Na+ symporter
LFVTACFALFTATPVLAAGTDTDAMDWGNMGMHLVGGLALFLFGMDQMADALKAVAGERMKIILARLTANRFMGAVTGAFVTAIIQSSSVTTVLVVGFITAGLMSMAQSIGIIMGANIGTTITAQIIAFKVTEGALLMIAVGFTLLFTSKREQIRHYGSILMGLGLVFFGMSVMSDAMAPLRTYPPFLELMTRMDNPLIGIVTAAAFTALVQSSSATTGIIIVMASQGFISLQAGIALALGANIGTCVTAMLASIGKPREAVRAALVHVLFNVFGVLLWVSFIDQLAQFVTTFSPTRSDLSGTELLAATTPRQIANAHTVFNIANTFIFIWFTAQFARLVEWLVPDKPLEEIVLLMPRYLDESLLETPSLALERVRMETGRMGKRVREMLQRIMPAILSGNRMTLSEIASIDDEVDALHGHIIKHLGQLSQQQLSDKQTDELVNLMSAVNDLENIGDLIETDMIHLGHERIDQGISISPATQEILTKLHRMVSDAVDVATTAVMEEDLTAAQEVISLKGDIDQLVDSAATHQAKRLVAAEPNRLAAYALEIDITGKLKRIYYHAKRMAKTIAPEEKVEEAAATETS